MLCEAYEKAFHFNLSFFLISVVFSVHSFRGWLRMLAENIRLGLLT